jgi:sulfur dioxygenase
MIFRQLFETESSTYTYLLGDPTSGLAVLVDPVLETVERDLEVVRSLGLTLAYTLETHVHADHLTGARKLKALVGSRIAVPAMERLPCADAGVEEGRPFVVGALSFDPLFTPGHTDTHHAYQIEAGGVARVFTGDALLIDGCGRTDFQGGSAEALYLSVRQKLFALPEDALVFPAHDYQGRRVSTVAQERARNPRLRDGIERDEFVRIMRELKLPYPKKMDYAVPGNRECGRCPEEQIARMEALCGPSYQGVPSQGGRRDP